MTANEKIEAIDNKIKQNKSQYHLDRQTAKILTSSRNDDKYELLTTGDILSEKELLEKAICSQKIRMLFVRLRIRSTNSNCKRSV